MRVGVGAVCVFVQKTMVLVLCSGVHILNIVSSITHFYAISKLCECILHRCSICCAANGSIKYITRA